MFSKHCERRDYVLTALFTVSATISAARYYVDLPLDRCALKNSGPYLGLLLSFTAARRSRGRLGDAVSVRVYVNSRWLGLR